MWWIYVNAKTIRTILNSLVINGTIKTNVSKTKGKKALIYINQLN